MGLLATGTELDIVDDELRTVTVFGVVIIGLVILDKDDTTGSDEVFIKVPCTSLGAELEGILCCEVTLILL